MEPVPSEPTRVPLPGGFDLLKNAFSFYQGHWRIIFTLASVPAIFAILEAILRGSPVSFLFGILASLGGILTQIAIILLAADAGGSATAKNLLTRGVRFIIPFLIVSSLAAFSALGGLLLLIIPGILVALWLSVSLYVAIVEGKRNLAALAGSWYYTQGRAGEIFLRLLILGIFILITFIPTALLSGIPTDIQNITQEAAIPLPTAILQIFIQSYIASPLGILFLFGIYQALKNAKPAPISPEEEKKYRRYIITFLILGAIGLVLIVAIFGALFIWYAQDFIPPASSPMAESAPYRELGSALTSFGPLLNLIQSFR